MSATVMLNPAIHRKPIPGSRSFNDLQQQSQQPSPSQSVESYAQHRASSTSPNPAMQQQVHPPRFSSASSMAATAVNSSINRVPTNSSMPRRSTSSRSNGSTASPTSYVALMRKQKATVWCDRAQHEDPNILAQKRQAKMRADQAVAGGRHHGNRTSTSSSGQYGGSSLGIRSKIRHPGATKTNAYLGGANMSGAGVPLRLSATEMEDEAKDNKRSGSGRSSAGSAARISDSHLGSNLGISNDTSPLGDYSPSGSMGYVPEEETPLASQVNTSQTDYFEGSGDDSSDAEERFGGITGLPPSKPKTEQDMKKEEELRRRGSVDDRAMTMSGQRLFVANPDLSD